MKKIKIITVLFLLALTTIIKASDSIPLTSFVELISYEFDTTFVISEDIQKDINITIANDLSKFDYIEILTSVLRANNLQLEPHKNFMLISKKIENDEKLQYLYLNAINYDTIKSLFQYNKYPISHFIASKNIVVFKASNEEYQRIKVLVSQLDKVIQQQKLKVTIIDTNINKLKELGIDNKININQSSNFFFNLLAYPFSVTSEINSNQKDSLSTYIKFLNQNDVSKIVTSTTLNLFNNRETILNNVKTIPYSLGSTTVTNSQTVTNSNIELKDIGLKFKVLPQIYDNFTYLDLDITIENILDNSETPTISKSQIKQPVRLNRGYTYVLTGINRNEDFNNVSKVPVLGDIPLFEWLFKIESKENVQSNLTIILELTNSFQEKIK